MEKIEIRKAALGCDFCDGQHKAGFMFKAVSIPTKDGRDVRICEFCMSIINSEATRIFKLPITKYIEEDPTEEGPCGSCGKTIQDKSKHLCSSCTEQLNKKFKAQPPKIYKQPEVMTNCTNCGETIPKTLDAVPLCSNCKDLVKINHSRNY